MRKSDKKIDNQIRQALTQLCENHLKDLPGFCWITHTVNYQQFPQSLNVTCVFDDDDALSHFEQSDASIKTKARIINALNPLDIKQNILNQCIHFTTVKKAP